MIFLLRKNNFFNISLCIYIFKLYMMNIRYMAAAYPGLFDNIKNKYVIRNNDTKVYNYQYLII